MTSYFVTGGTGLIGSHVVRELVDRGYDEDDIIVYDLFPNEDAICGVLDDVTLIEGDVTDEDQLLKTFETYTPDRIIHLAAYVAHRSWDNPTEAIEVNCIGTNRVFDVARTFDVSTCLYASSASVYGGVEDYYWKDDPVLVHESDPVKPQNPYAVTKYTNEVMGRTYDEKYGPNFVGIRIGGAWGRGRLEGATGQLNEFVRNAGLGNDVTVPAYWTMWERINLSYGKEIGRWFVDVVNMDQFTHQIYNQGNRDPYRIEDVVETLEQLVPGVTIEYPDPAENDDWSSDLANPELDVSRWYSDLGLTQEWTLEDAMTDFVNHCRRQKGLDEVHIEQ